MHQKTFRLGPYVHLASNKGRTVHRRNNFGALEKKVLGDQKYWYKNPSNAGPGTACRVTKIVQTVLLVHMQRTDLKSKHSLIRVA